MKQWKFKLIAKIVLIAVILTIIVVIITVGAMNAKAITRQYNALSNKPVNSARQFKIPFGYITVSSDGTVDIEFASTSSFMTTNPNVDDIEFEGADGEDDRQNSGPDAEGDSNTGGGKGPDSTVDDNTSGGDFVSTAKDITSLLEESDNPSIVRKADTLAKVYKTIGEKYGAAAAIGIMASIVEEGEPGLVQYGHSINSWDGPGKDSKESTMNNPLVLGSDTNVNAFKSQCNVPKNKTGIGIVQWTYYTYFNDGGLLDYYKDYCSEDGYTYDNMLSAELAYLKQCVGWVSGYPPSETDVSACAKSWVYDFERPDGADAAAQKRAKIAEELKKLLT